MWTCEACGYRRNPDETAGEATLFCTSCGAVRPYWICPVGREARNPEEATCPTHYSRDARAMRSNAELAPPGTALGASRLGTDPIGNNHCAHCGAVLGGSERFCSSCGTPLIGGTPPVTPATSPTPASPVTTAPKKLGFLDGWRDAANKRERRDRS